MHCDNATFIIGHNNSQQYQLTILIVYLDATGILSIITFLINEIILHPTFTAHNSKFPSQYTNHIRSPQTLPSTNGSKNFNSVSNPFVPASYFRKQALTTEGGGI
jgi:hypothetical protein